MSRSNPNESLQNPATRFCEWSGSEGKLRYFDKSLGEKGQNVDVPLPFTFLVLDTLLTIKGYDQNAGSGIWSNEIRQTESKTAILTVKNKHGEIAKGTYEQIKEKVKSLGGKYAQSCYIAFRPTPNSPLEIGHIMFSGSSFGGGEHKTADKKKVEIGAWIGFTKEVGKKINEMAVKMEVDERICTNGATKFYCPKFSLTPVSADTNEIACELDKELQEYLSAYFLKQNTPEAPKPEQKMTIEEAKEAFAKNNVPMELLGTPAAQTPFGNNTQEYEPLPF